MKQPPDDPFFNQMLYWEAENPANWAVHHLMVLSYHLQHPHLYSPQTLHHAMLQLAEFLETDISIQAMRAKMKDQVDSGKRKIKITGTPDSYGEYAYPIEWQMHAEDVVKAGEPNYIDGVRAWARSILEDLRKSGNFPA